MARLAPPAATLLIAAACAAPSWAAHRQVSVVFFTQWSALLDDTAKTLIKKDADMIAAADDTHRVVVTGYADTTGTTEANRLLSATRAQVVMDQLIADGVVSGRLRRASRGATPDVGGTNESRRVTIAIGAG